MEDAPEGQSSSSAPVDADKLKDLTCGFLTNFLSFGLIVFCTLLKL